MSSKVLYMTAVGLHHLFYKGDSYIKCSVPFTGRDIPHLAVDHPPLNVYVGEEVFDARVQVMLRYNDVRLYLFCLIFYMLKLMVELLILTCKRLLLLLCKAELHLLSLKCSVLHLCDTELLCIWKFLFKKIK